jgi:transcription antitermination factor NusG
MLLVASHNAESSPVPRSAVDAVGTRVWSVLHVRSRQEKAVADVLGEAGIPTFLPLTRLVRTYGHRRRVVDAVLFPSYVFVRSTIEETYFAMATKRVARVIKVPDQARFEREVEHIRNVIHLGGALTASPFLVKGARVRVTTGPFRGVEGLVEESRNWDRINLQIQTLGRAASLEVDACVLERVDD